MCLLWMIHISDWLLHHSNEHYSYNNRELIKITDFSAFYCGKKNAAGSSVSAYNRPTLTLWVNIAGSVVGWTSKLKMPSYTGYYKERITWHEANECVREKKRLNGMKSSAVIKCSGQREDGSAPALVRAGWSVTLINVWPSLQASGRAGTG